MESVKKSSIFRYILQSNLFQYVHTNEPKYYLQRNVTEMIASLVTTFNLKFRIKFLISSVAVIVRKSHLNNFCWFSLVGW